MYEHTPSNTRPELGNALPQLPHRVSSLSSQSPSRKRQYGDINRDQDEARNREQLEVTAQLHNEEYEHQEKRSKLEGSLLNSIEVDDQNAYEVPKRSRKALRPNNQRRISRFIEGSMRDRASQQPPSLYTEEERTERQHLADQAGEASRRSIDTDTFHDAGIERSKPSGVVRFGRALASVFNPAYVWSGFSGMRKEKYEEPTKPQQSIPDERKVKAETEYAELKKRGLSGTLKVAKFRYSFDVPSIKREEGNSDGFEPVPHRCSGADLDEYRSDIRRKRNGMIFDIDGTEMKSPTLPPRDSATSSLRSDQSSSLRSSLNTRKPSLPSLKKVKSHFHLSPSKRSSVTPAPMSPTKSEAQNTDLDTNVIKKQPSRKDLHKQQKLTKRVSDLESKLETARRELLQAMHGSSSVPDLSPRKTPHSFIPGALPSLPSERALYVHDSESGHKNKARFPETVPEPVSIPAVPKLPHQFQAEPFIFEQKSMDHKNTENVRLASVSRSHAGEDDGNMIGGAQSTRSEIVTPSPVKRISSLKLETEDLPKFSEETIHVSQPSREKVQKKPEIPLEPALLLEKHPVFDSQTKILEPETSLGVMFDQQIDLEPQSVIHEKVSDPSVAFHPVFPASVREKTTTNSQVTSKKPRVKKRKSDSTYKPKKDESDDEGWESAPKSVRGKISNASAVAPEVDKRISPRSVNGKKSPKVHKNDSPNSISKRKPLKVQKTNSPLSAKSPKSSKVKKEAPVASSNVEEEHIKHGATVSDPLILDDDPMESQLPSQSQATASVPTGLTPFESKLSNGSKIKHDPPKPFITFSTVSEPFDPEKVDKGKLISMRSNPNSTHAFGWNIDDIPNLKKEFPNMTQGQLNKYISALFSGDPKPSLASPRTVRKAPSIANQRSLMKRASLSPIKQPYQSITDGGRSSSPEKCSLEEANFGMSPSHSHQKPQLSKSPSPSHAFPLTSESAVHSSLADLVGDSNAVTISPGKDKNVPPVPPVPKGLEGYTAKVFTAAAQKEDYQWDDDVF